MKEALVYGVTRRKRMKALEEEEEKCVGRDREATTAIVREKWLREVYDGDSSNSKGRKKEGRRW